MSNQSNQCDEAVALRFDEFQEGIDFSGRVEANSDSRGKQNETKDFNRQQHPHEFMSKFHLGHIQISY